MRKLDIFGTGIRAISSTITSQRRVNMYYDPRPDLENNPIVLIQTPGLTRLVTLPEAPIRGMWQNGNYAYVVAGGSLFLITYQGFTFVGSFGNGNSTPVSMRNSLIDLVIVDGSNVYSFPLKQLQTLITSPGQILTGLTSLGNIVNS
jgi:hypothetical protein